MANCCASAYILNTTLSLITFVSNNLGLENLPEYVFRLNKFRNDIEVALKPTGFEL